MTISQPQPPEPRKRGRAAWVSWSCALSPFALLFVFLAFGVHIRFGLGHWPTPMFEDYHSTASSIHEWIRIICLWFALFVAGPLWLVCLLVPALRPVWAGTVVFQLWTYAAGWLGIIAVLTFDPTTFSAWFRD